MNPPCRGRHHGQPCEMMSAPALTDLQAHSSAHVQKKKKPSLWIRRVGRAGGRSGEPTSGKWVAATSDQGERSCCCCCTRSLHCAAALGSSDAVATPLQALHMGRRGGQATRDVCTRKQAYTSSTDPRTHPRMREGEGRDGRASCMCSRPPVATPTIPFT